MLRSWNIPITIETKFEGKTEHHNNFIPLGMRMIGLRLYTPDNANRELERKVRCMQKSLFESNEWFYFVHGFRIVESNEQIERIIVEEDVFDSAFCLYNGTREPEKQKDTSIGKGRLQQLNINAVIGQNGTGKSTLIDMVIRLMNNLSVAVYGENYVFSSAQHLHYIENVYASLAVYIDDKIRVLTIKGYDIELSTFVRSESNFEDSIEQEVYVYNKQDTLHILSHNQQPTEVLLNGNRIWINHFLKDWFYTIVSNYSLYAYNYRDYFMERTSDAKIESLRAQMDDEPQEEDYYWLKGVFHKNDGYQMPLVISPMRQNGYIDAAKENYLGKQNLIMLSFHRVTYKDNNRITEYDGFPFRIINQTHQVVTLYHTWKSSRDYQGFVDTYLYGNQTHDSYQLSKLKSLELAYNDVRKYWAGKIGLCGIGEDCSKLFNKQHYIKRQAWDYVVAKTFKILQNYTEYKEDFRFFTEQYNVDNIESHLDKLLKDNTHRTRKLRRTLAFIKLFNEHYSIQARPVDVDDAYDWMIQYVGKPLYVGDAAGYHQIDIEDLLPPPCCADVQVGLVEVKKVEDYKRQKVYFLDIIPFEGLSSGERQIAYTIGNLLYHAINIDSTVDNFNPVQETIKYRHLNVLMDEVELYFHPDLQRRFVKLLVDAFNQSTWLNITSVNITLITHSPFVLSDIPRSNILCLTRGGEVHNFDRTFAANIHDLFNNTFILPNTIGELAKSLVEELVMHYDDQVERWRNEDKNSVPRTALPESQAWFERNVDRYDYICHIVGDEYLREELSDMYQELKSFYHSNCNA